MQRARKGEARLAEWIAWGRRYRRWSESTIASYRRRVADWLDWCDANGIRATRATTDDARAYMGTIYPSASVHTSTRTALKAWFDWLVWRGSRRANPICAIERMPARRSIPRSLESDDAARVLAAALDHGVRWHTYLSLMLYAGLRRVEACRVRWTDFEGRDAWLRIVGKGGQERVLPVHPELRRSLTRLRTDHSHREWLFPGQSGDAPICVATATKHVRAILDAAGLPQATGHWCRHTTATTALVAGADIAAVSALLGHRDLSTTSRYVMARPERVRDAVWSLSYEAAP